MSTASSLAAPAALSATVTGTATKPQFKPAPFTLEPEQAVTSLDRIEGVDATWLLPGHGPAWDGGVPEAIRLIREASAEQSRHRLPTG